MFCFSLAIISTWLVLGFFAGILSMHVDMKINGFKWEYKDYKFAFTVVPLFGAFSLLFATIFYICTLVEKAYTKE